MISSASSLCMILSLRQSCASETAARVRFPLYCSSFFSNRSQSENASATDPCKANHDLIVVEPAHLFCRRLHDDGFAHRHLSVARDRCFSVLLNGEYRRTPEFQSGYPPVSSPMFAWRFRAANGPGAGRFYPNTILAQSGRIRPHSAIRFQFFHDYSIITDILR